MHPALRNPCTRELLSQCGKVITAHWLRPHADKVDDIQLPPEPTTCCMSGCANCVWIEYAETLSKLFDGNDEKVREIILSKITDPNLKMFLSVELRNMQHKESNNNNNKTAK